MTEVKQAIFKIWRGDAEGGEFRDYTTGVSEGMVVLDAVNDIQATQAKTLPAGGTVKPENAARAQRKSTACPN